MLTNLVDDGTGRTVVDFPYDCDAMWRSTLVREHVGHRVIIEPDMGIDYTGRLLAARETEFYIEIHPAGRPLIRRFTIDDERIRDIKLVPGIIEDIRAKAYRVRHILSGGNPLDKVEHRHLSDTSLTSGSRYSIDD